MSEFLTRLHALYAEFPEDAKAFESEFTELQRFVQEIQDESSLDSASAPKGKK